MCVSVPADVGALAAGRAPIQALLGSRVSLPPPPPSALPALPLLLFAPPGFIRSVWEELGLLGGGPLWRQPGRGLHNLCFHSRPVEQGAWLPPFWRSRVCRGSEKSQFQPSTCQELAGSSGTLRGGV